MTSLCLCWLSSKTLPDFNLIHQGLLHNILEWGGLTQPALKFEFLNGWKCSAVPVHVRMLKLCKWQDCQWECFFSRRMILLLKRVKIRNSLSVHFLYCSTVGNSQQLVVACRHFVTLMQITVSRPCHMSEFTPYRALIMVSGDFEPVQIKKSNLRVIYTWCALSFWVLACCMAVPGSEDWKSQDSRPYQLPWWSNVSWMEKAPITSYSVGDNHFNFVGIVRTQKLKLNKENLWNSVYNFCNISRSTNFLPRFSVDRKNEAAITCVLLAAYTKNGVNSPTIFYFVGYNLIINFW